MTESGPAPVKLAGHSGVGIATFVIGILAGLGQLVPMIGFVMPVLSWQPHSSQQIQAWLDFSTFSSLFSCLSPALAIFGIGLGIASLVQRGRGRRLGVIGLILNGSVLILQLLFTLLTPVIAELLCHCRN